MGMIEKYLRYINEVRRYSARTQELYDVALKDFMRYSTGKEEEWSDEDFTAAMRVEPVRNYEVSLMDERKMSPRTVNLHLSVISGFSRFLIKENIIRSNPVKLISRPKVKKRLPVFFRKELLSKYFSDTDIYASEENMDMLEGKDEVAAKYYEMRRRRLIIKILRDRKSVV